VLGIIKKKNIISVFFVLPSTTITINISALPDELAIDGYNNHIQLFSHVHYTNENYIATYYSLLDIAYDHNVCSYSLKYPSKL